MHFAACVLRVHSPYSPACHTQQSVISQIWRNATDKGLFWQRPWSPTPASRSQLTRPSLWWAPRPCWGRLWCVSLCFVYCVGVGCVLLSTKPDPFLPSPVSRYQYSPFSQSNIISFITFKKTDEQRCYVFLLVFILEPNGVLHIFGYKWSFGNALNLCTEEMKLNSLQIGLMILNNDGKKKLFSLKMAFLESICCSRILNFLSSFQKITAFKQMLLSLWFFF